MIHMHVGILTKSASGVIFCLSQARQMEDQPRICILLSHIIMPVLTFLYTSRETMTVIKAAGTDK